MPVCNIYVHVGESGQGVIGKTAIISIALLPALESHMMHVRNDECYVP